MKKVELIYRLICINSKVNNRDAEKDHWDADKLLLEFIDDEDVSREYNKIDKWYS